MNTPYEREVLKRLDRMTELLELLVMAHQPMKVMTGALMPGEETIKAEELAARVQAGKVPIEQALAAAGILPMRVPGQPPTPEQRAQRFADRAREVGMSEEKATEVSGRVQLNLDNLRDGAADPGAEAAAAEKKPPRKRTPRTAG